MLSFKTIDLAIGMALLYLLVTFAASALLELVSLAANWRPQMLHDGIANMLKDSSLATVDEIYDHPQILALNRGNAAPSRVDWVERFGWKPPRVGGWQHGTPPSYIPAVNFSAAVLETVLNRAESPFDLSPDGVVKGLQDILVPKPDTPRKDAPGSLPATPRKDALASLLRTTLATQGASIQAVRFALEKWFTDSMDRVSGWYKRRTQCFLLFIGLAVAYGGNISTVAVGRWLWQSDSARQAAVAAAKDVVAKDSLQTPPATESQKPPQGASGSKGGSSGATQTGNPSLDRIADQIAAVDRRIIDLQYPVGWNTDGLKDPTSWLGGYLVGCLLTAIAISMGSTFWFDALQNLVKIRGAGPKPSGR